MHFGHCTTIIICPEQLRDTGHVATRVLFLCALVIVFICIFVLLCRTTSEFLHIGVQTQRHRIAFWHFFPRLIKGQMSVSGTITQ